MDCEICGAPEAGYVVLVEGAKLRVCADCSGSGKLISSPQPSYRKSDAPAKAKEELEVVDGYGKLIAEARKRMGLPLEVLAERINEKHSFLERVEHERTLPDEKLARKLEKELGIKLLSSGFETTAAPASSGKGAGVTLGDILEIQRKERKG